MNDFALSVVVGLGFGFLFGLGCSLAVMHAIYLRGYRKAVADSLEPAKPKVFREALKKIEARRARKALPAPAQETGVTTAPPNRPSLQRPRVPKP
jgi:hypothetical protein